MTLERAEATTRQSVEAVFLDRDGTLIENRHYLKSPEGVTALAGAREALSLARAAGAKLFLFTNQSGVGRGFFSLADVEAVNRRMIEMFDLGDDLFEAICVAPERPDEPAMYRKPSPRFILEMLGKHGFDPTRVWMVGDSPSDWQAGINAGVRAAAIFGQDEDPSARHRRLEAGVERFSSLLDWSRKTF